MAAQVAKQSSLLLPKFKLLKDPFESFRNTIHSVFESISSKLQFEKTIEISEEFLTLPSDMQYITGYASGFLHFILRASIHKTPSKIIVGVDEELNEPQLTLVFSEKLSAEEEIRILSIISRVLLSLARKKEDERFLDIHIIVDYP